MTRCRPYWFLLFVLPATGVLSADTAVPVFDAHIHYNADASNGTAPEAVIQIFDRAGVTRALVSSTPNDGTRLLHEKYPDRIVPMLRPYRTNADRGGWFDDPAILAFVEQELRRGIYRGIGEFHLFSGHARSDVMRRIVDLAVQRNMLLHAHSDEGAIRELFAINPESKILWAHAGMASSPAQIVALLDRHATLWIELSGRNSDIAPGGRLDPAWHALFLQHPDRFLIGTDTWTPQRWREVTTEMTAARRWLGQLPREIAEKIATGNAERVFPR
ncbi:MAG TPA: amidohydrolase family protein [Gammaproteobacteria bacterium]|jgi:hypothetical protein